MARMKTVRVLPVLVAAAAASVAAACSGRGEWFPDRELHYRRNPPVREIDRTDHSSERMLRAR